MTEEHFEESRSMCLAFFFREEPIGFGFQRLRLMDFRMCFYSFNGIAVLGF